MTEPTKRVPTHDTQDILDAIDTAVSTSRAFRRQLSLEAAQRTLDCAAPPPHTAPTQIHGSSYCCQPHYDEAGGEKGPWDEVPREDATGAVCRTMPGSMTDDDCQWALEARVHFVGHQRNAHLNGLPVPLWEVEDARRLGERAEELGLELEPPPLEWNRDFPRVERPNPHATVRESGVICWDDLPGDGGHLTDEQVARLREFMGSSRLRDCSAS